MSNVPDPIDFTSEERDPFEDERPGNPLRGLDKTDSDDIAHEDGLTEGEDAIDVIRTLEDETADDETVAKENEFDSF